MYASIYVDVFQRCLECVYVLFSTVHPLNVFLVVCFELLAFQFEGVGDQAGLWCPGLGAQTDLLGDLESLQFCWLGGREREQNRKSVWQIQCNTSASLPQAGRHRTKSELIIWQRAPPVSTLWVKTLSVLSILSVWVILLPKLTFNSLVSISKLF